MILREHGITIQGLATPMSVLFIQSRGIEDQIRLTCQALHQSDSNNRVSSNIAAVSFFGKLKMVLDQWVGLYKIT